MKFKKTLVVILVIITGISVVLIRRHLLSGYFLRNQVLNNPRDECKKVWGKWAKFPDGCVDSCHSVRRENVICIQSPAEGCDCGVFRCWNGETCEPN